MKKNVIILFFSLATLNLSAQDFKQTLGVITPKKNEPVWSADTIVEYLIDSKTSVITLPRNYDNVQYNITLSNTIKPGDYFIINGCNAQNPALVIIKLENKTDLIINSCCTQVSVTVDKIQLGIVMQIATFSKNNIYVSERLCKDIDILKN